jgi:hypothetical protein
MANCLFAYPDYTTRSSYGVYGYNWSSDFPVTNLSNKLRSKFAQTNMLSSGGFAYIGVLTNNRPVRVIALLNHNLSANATIDIYFGTSSSSWGDIRSILGIPVRPTYFPPGTPAAWASAPYEDDPLSKLRRDFWYVLPESLSCGDVRIFLREPTLSSFTIDIGRCFISDALQPTLNMDYGAGMSWKQEVDKVTSLGGVDWFNIKSQGREFSGTLGNMSVAEGMVMIFDTQRRLGQEGELYFIFDPDDTVGLYKQRAMLCRFADADALQYPYFDSTSGSFLLREIR